MSGIGTGKFKGSGDGFVLAGGLFAPVGGWGTFVSADGLDEGGVGGAFDGWEALG